MNRKILLSALLLSLTTGLVFAQPKDREIVNQSIEWFSITTTTKVSQKLSVILEGQFRTQSFDPQQYQLRTALDIKLNDHFSIVPLGYVFTWNYKYGKQPTTFENDEHRLWQQVMYKHKIGRVKIDHRLRFEERFIQVHSEQNDVLIDEGYTNKQFRIRYRFMARVPLNHTTIEPKTYFLSFYDEAFMSRGKKVTFHEPDQNRVFAGLGYEFSKKVTVQGGLLYQMLIKSNGAKQENNVGLQVMLNYNLSLLKQQ